MDRCAVRVFLNERASYGRASKRWAAVEGELRARAGEFDVEPAASLARVAESVRLAFDRGERVFIAAGGDGTVNMLVNAIMALEDRSNVSLGAVGLGSSNDFHKQRLKGAVIALSFVALAQLIVFYATDNRGGGYVLQSIDCK